MRLFISLLVLLGALCSCNSDSSLSPVDTQAQLIPVYENGKIVSYINPNDVRVLTDEEIEDLVKQGLLSPDKRNRCEWSDGRGGSVDCDGGNCAVVHSGANGQTGLGCYEKGGGLRGVGAWR